MSKKIWFHSVKVSNRTKVLQISAKARDRGNPLPKYRGHRLIDLDAWQYPHVGFKILYIDRMEVFYTTGHITKMFDIDKSTLYKWIDAGIFPQPLLTKENTYGKKTRYYVRPQLRVAATVINDLYRQGVIRFTRKKVKHHIDMVTEGNRLALERWHKRRDRSIEREAKGKGGVTWIG